MTSSLVPSHFGFVLHWFLPFLCRMPGNNDNKFSPALQERLLRFWMTHQARVNWGESAREVIRSILIFWNAQVKKCCQREAAYLDRNTYSMFEIKLVSKGEAASSSVPWMHIYGEKRAAANLSLHPVVFHKGKAKECMHANHFEQPYFFWGGPSACIFKVCICSCHLSRAVMSGGQHSLQRFHLSHACFRIESLQMQLRVMNHDTFES